jgi:hypothetical protein
MSFRVRINAGFVAASNIRSPPWASPRWEQNLDVMNVLENRGVCLLSPG